MPPLSARSRRVDGARRGAALARGQAPGIRGGDRRAYHEPHAEARTPGVRPRRMNANAGRTTASATAQQRPSEALPADRVPLDFAALPERRTECLLCEDRQSIGDVRRARAAGIAVGQQHLHPRPSRRELDELHPPVTEEPQAPRAVGGGDAVDYPQRPEQTCRAAGSVSTRANRPASAGSLGRRGRGNRGCGAWAADRPRSRSGRSARSPSKPHPPPVPKPTSGAPAAKSASWREP